MADCDQGLCATGYISLQQAGYNLGSDQVAKAMGNPKDTWQTAVYNSLSSLHVQYKSCSLAQDRTGWTQLLPPVRTELSLSSLSSTFFSSNE